MSSTANPTMNGQSPRTLTVIFHSCDEGGVVAECIELPGCFSQGESQEEAERNIREAINACLGVLFEDCLERLRASIDFGNVNFKHVSRQERFAIQTPQLQTAEYV